MSVTRADRAQDTSRITDLREEYENRETQAEKKKSLEIKRNQKKHQDELKDVKQTYEDKISNLQEKYADKLNETEQKHQKQISDVRSLYLNQLKNKMEEANTEKKVLNDNYQMEAETQDKINESQKDLLKKRFQEEISKRDENINTLHEKTRVGLQQSVNTRSRKLQEAYNKELNTLKGNQEVERERFLKEKADSKDFYKSQISDLNKTKERQNTNWENKFSNAIEALGQQYSENDQVKQEILQEELHRNKEKFDQKYEKLENRVLQANDTFRDSVDDRYNNQVRSRDAEINKLKNRMYVDQANLSKRKDLEKKNVIVEYEKRQANIEDMLDQQRESLKSVNVERIDKVINTNSKFNNELQKRTKIEQNLVNEKHRQDRAALAELHRNETFNIQNSSEKRIDTIQKIANNKETKLVSYYDEYLDQMRDGYMDKIYEQREKHDKDLLQLNALYGEKFRKLKENFERKLEKVAGGYEDKINKMSDDGEKDKKYLTTIMNTKLEEKEKENKMSLNSIEKKYESKIKNIQDQYEDQLTKLNDRHENELKSMALKMQNYSRKA